LPSLSLPRLSLLRASAARLLALTFLLRLSLSFFSHDTATTEIYTLSLHDALPIFLCLLQLAPDEKRPFLASLDYQFELVCLYLEYQLGVFVPPHHQFHALLAYIDAHLLAYW